MKTAIAIAASLPVVAGCSWGRFDEVTEETPVVLLHKPGELKTGFGVSLSTATLDKRVRLLSAGGTGRTPAAVFDLGTGDQPTLDASQKGYCSQAAGNTCFLGFAVAGMPQLRVPNARDPLDLCFVLGVGTFSPDNGLLVRCADNTEFVLPAIPEVEEPIDTALADPLQPALVVLAADRDPKTPAMAAALPKSQLAWYYGPDSSDPRPLPVPSGASVPKSYGRTLSVLKVGTKRVIAVGAPDEGRVYLFASEDPSSAWPIGCLGETENFGRSLAAGPVDAAGDDDLVIADAVNVHVFDGTALATLPFTSSSSCSLGGLPAGALIASFSCGSNGDVEGCASADFGKAVAVGDLDGDGDGEVIVGAPGMQVRDVSQAGAVLIYDVEGATKHRLTEIKFLSSAEEKDGLGSSLATPWLGTRHVIAAGAPGGGKTALFYCSSLIPASKRSARCR